VVHLRKNFQAKARHSGVHVITKIVTTCTDFTCNICTSVTALPIYCINGVHQRRQQLLLGIKFLHENKRYGAKRFLDVA